MVLRPEDLEDDHGGGGKAPKPHTKKAHRTDEDDRAALDDLKKNRGLTRANIPRTGGALLESDL